MRQASISHPKGSRFLLVRQDYLGICQGDHCQAALLATFEYWHEVRLADLELKQSERDSRQQPATQSGDLGITRSRNELQRDLLGLYRKGSIIPALRGLQRRGFLQRLETLPRERAMYLLEVTNIQKAVDEWAAAELPAQRRLELAADSPRAVDEGERKAKPLVRKRTSPLSENGQAPPPALSENGQEEVLQKSTSKEEGERRTASSSVGTSAGAPPPSADDGKAQDLARIAFAVSRTSGIPVSPLDPLPGELLDLAARQGCDRAALEEFIYHLKGRGIRGNGFFKTLVQQDLATWAEANPKRVEDQRRLDQTQPFIPMPKSAHQQENIRRLRRALGG